MRNAVALGSMLLVLAGRGYDSGSGPDGQAYTVAVSIASTDPMTAAGEIRLATAVVRDAYGSVISAPSVSWRTSAPAVATVAGSGASATVTAVDDGTASITAASGGAEGVITVTVRRSVVSIDLSAPDSSQEHRNRLLKSRRAHWRWCLHQALLGSRVCRELPPLLKPRHAEYHDQE